MTATREKIVSAAQELLQTRSFTGFSFEDVAERVGIRKPSLYHHFKTKNDLALAVLERSLMRLEAASHLRASLSAAEQLHDYLRSISEILGAGERICPGGAFIANWEVLPRVLRNGVKRLRQFHSEWLTRILEKGREDRTINFNGQSVDAVARWVFATVQGSLLVARASGNREDYDVVVEQLANALTASKSKH